MAKPIIVSHGGRESSFDLTKLDRSKLYGKRQRVMFDPAGEPCARAELTTDGDLLIRAGMAAQGYFDEHGYQYASKDLMGLDPDGNPVEKFPSTLGVPQDLVGPVDPTELLDLRPSLLYMLDPLDVEPALLEALEAGEIFRFAFSYWGDYTLNTGFLVANEEGLFAVIGQPAPPVWSALKQPLPLDTFDEEEEDELDFDMF